MSDAEELVLELMEEDSQMSVGELVDRLGDRQGIRGDEAAKKVYQLWQEEKIALRDPDPPGGLLRYAASLYSGWLWMLVLVVAFTTLSIYVFPQRTPYIYIRYVLGAVTVLYLPGSALIEALYPKQEDLQPLERVALSIGLSLALVPLVGLVLNYTPWGIRLNPIFASLCLVTLSLACAAVVRKFGYFTMKLEAAPGSEREEELG